MDKYNSRHSIDNENQIRWSTWILHLLVGTRRVNAFVPQLTSLAVSTNFSKQPCLLELLGTSRAHYNRKRGFDLPHTVLEWQFGNVPKGWADVRMACWFRPREGRYVSAQS
jgi:hypothetical protein